MAAEKVVYGYAVRWQIPESRPSLHHTSEFNTFHEAVMFAEDSTFAEIYAVVEGERDGNPIASCVNGDWIVENGEFAHLFRKGKYMAKDKGEKDVLADLLGEDDTKTSSQKKDSKTMAKSEKKKAVAKPAVKEAMKKTNGIGRSDISMTDKIKHTGKEHNAREGTRGGEVWKLCKDGITVQQFCNSFDKTKYAKEGHKPVPFLSYWKKKGVIRTVSK